VAEDQGNIRNFGDYSQTTGRQPQDRLKSGGGGGTSGGMEPRVAKLEAAVEHIQRDTTDIKTDVRTLRDNARTDFRVLFSAIIVVALGLAGMMARGFHWL